MPPRLGDIVLVRMRFHQAEGTKVRPALVLLDPTDDDFVAAPITSRPRAAAADLPLEDWRDAGLNVPSTARLGKLTVMSQSEILRHVGSLPEKDRAILANALCRIFCTGGGHL